MESAENRLRQVLARIEAACQRAGRQPGAVTLLGAAKTVPAERLLPYIQAGLTDVGENYVQEGVAKQQALADAAASAASTGVRWHLIGALQSNKARAAVASFDLIHSVDRPSLAQALNKAAGEAGKVQDVLLQVNLGDEATKAGCAPEQLSELMAAYRQLPHLAVRGLMCLPPYQEDPEGSRPYFRRLCELAEEVRGAQNDAAVWHLSMGMTNDFEVAIEEGATLVRVGTGLFGARAG